MFELVGYGLIALVVGYTLKPLFGGSPAVNKDGSPAPKKECVPCGTKKFRKK